MADYTFKVKVSLSMYCFFDFILYYNIVDVSMVTDGVQQGY